jgi:excisionase family DNA binding protein
MEEILTAEQVAQILQVHPFTVLKFIKQGKLKASKLGRVYRIRRSDVDNFLDNQVEQKGSTSKSPLKKEKKTTKKEKKVIKTEEKKTDIASSKTSQEEQVQNVPEETKKRRNNSDIDHYILELKTR